MKLQQATRYAIWAAVETASRPGELVSAGDLAAKFGVSQHHLAKVLRTLALAKIVSSTRGPAGGCMFIADPRRLTLYDIVSLFESDWWNSENGVREGKGTTVADEVSRVLREIDRITSATLRSVTIQTLINNAARRRRREAAEKAGAGPSAQAEALEAAAKAAGG
ncbi:Rrf2 family transcriptional regulator [Propylenella binzhouense]|uniref:Rrf2 family transcriptional regulator n=1 Tax=Propylenella binzhouense TaxID=2555902 RepID=A0A964T7H8_9HYPH|nr:Rrf2 family transcriptional regulator [Propylenella binzhouense]MYZ49966.1 Rrf2 family transcriptional regulator [Propylenella binzhouense]